jgi:hypothetical protein
VENIANMRICLVLNKNWQVIDIKSVKRAFVSFASNDLDGKSVSAILITEEIEGDPEFKVLSWEEWLQLEVPENEPYICTATRKIRIPTVLIAHSIDTVPFIPIKARPTKHDIRQRDSDIDQYSGKRIPNKDDVTIDHIIPKSRGGKDVWENLVVTTKKTNLEKNNKTPEEAGLKLIKPPKRPSAKKKADIIKEIKHPHWRYFIK